MNEILHIINEMSPFLLLGFFIAGLMHAYIPSRYFNRYLSRSDFRSVLYAALIGVPLPLCSCGVIPTAMSLRKEGASKGAVASFLIATPQTGVDSIVATYSLMGLPFAIIRPIAALVTALFGGQLVNSFTKNEKNETVDDNSAEKKCCCHKEAEHTGGDCCGGELECHCKHAEAEPSMTFWQKMKVALRYAFVDMIEDIGKWLVVGLVVAALITVLVPDEFFAVFADNTWLSMLLVLAISIPMYVCATGSIPIAVALMLKGLTPGAALVLLMAGPAANAASILVIRHRLGTKTLVAYLAAIIGGAVAFGAGIDYLLPREWFTGALVAMNHGTDFAPWWQWASTAVLAALLLYVFAARQRSATSCPHCNHE